MRFGNVKNLKGFIGVSCLFLGAAIMLQGCMIDDPVLQEEKPAPMSDPATISINIEGVTKKLDQESIFLQSIADARDGYDLIDESGMNLYQFFSQAFNQHVGTYEFGRPGMGIKGLYQQVKELNLKDGFNAQIKYVVIPKFVKTQVTPKKISYDEYEVGAYASHIGQISAEYQKYGSFVTNVDITGDFDIEIELAVYDYRSGKTSPIMVPKLTCHASDWHLTSLQPMNDYAFADQALYDAKHKANFYTQSGLTNYIVNTAIGQYGFLKPFVTRFVDSLY